MGGQMNEARGANGTVTFDGHTITIDRKGGAGSIIGKGQKAIPLAAITAVQWKPAGTIVRGYIQFTLPGGNEVQSRTGRATVAAAKDENSVLFGKAQAPAFEALRDAINGALTP